MSQGMTKRCGFNTATMNKRLRDKVAKNLVQKHYMSTRIQIIFNPICYKKRMVNRMRVIDYLRQKTISDMKCTNKIKICSIH